MPVPPPVQPKKPKPTIAERAAERTCPECSGPVVRRSARGPFPTFCSDECKRARGNRRLARGAAIVEFAMAWRIDRGSGEIAKGSFAQLCQIIDTFNAEDLAYKGPNGERRGRADLMAAKVLATETIYADRSGR